MSHHVLIVDDDELVLTGLAASLEREGYRTTTALSGQEALALLPDGEVDAVLADMVMDEMDGLQLLDHVIQRHPHIPVLILTGHGTAENALLAMRRGAADYIQKPARAEEIARRIRDALDARQFQQRLREQHETDRERRVIRQAREERRQRMESLCTFAHGIAGDLGAIKDDLASSDANLQAAGRTRLVQLSDDLGQICCTERLKLQPVDLNGVVRAYLESPQFRVHVEQAPAVQVDFRSENLAPVEISSADVRDLLDALMSAAFAVLQNQGRVLIRTSHEFVADGADHYDPLPSAHYAILHLRGNKMLAPEHADRLFEPYFARGSFAPSLTDGLCLSRVHTIMRRHGGGADLHTDPNWGTEFRLYFPLRTAEAKPAAAGTVPARNLTALVIDDQPAHGRIGEKILADMGFKTRLVESAEAAVALVHQMKEGGEPPFALILIDFVLGGKVDGVEAYRLITEVFPEQKAILASGFADLSRIQEGRKLGMRLHAKKPYTPENLGKVVRMLMAEA